LAGLVGERVTPDRDTILAERLAALRGELPQAPLLERPGVPDRLEVGMKVQDDPNRPEVRHGRIVAKWPDTETGEEMLLLVAGVKATPQRHGTRYEAETFVLPAGDVDLQFAPPVAVRYDVKGIDNLMIDLLNAAADALRRREQSRYDDLLGWALALNHARRAA
jgi:hypothetical protein